MKQRRSRTLSLAVTTALAALAAGAPPLPAQQHKGYGRMWTFENPPLGYLKDEYGFAANQEWLDALRLASLRFGGWCSASLVSPKGLIMTNHHCVRDNIAAISPPGADWVKNGFYAAALDDEPRLYSMEEGERVPLTVQQLVAMKDVTDAINAGLAADDDDAAIDAKRKQNEAAVLEAARAAQPDLDPQVVKLHQGARFMLYSYKVWDDVRLVCAPHLQSAHFGGDPDNFTYPRYSIDFAFCRAYEDGKPADTGKHYFRWSKTGALENDLVFVTGNPGSTGRLLTVAQMEFLRDAEYPLTLDFIDSQLEILRKWTKRLPQLEEALRTNILSFENSQKAIRGYRGGLLDRGLMAAKARAEAEFRAKVKADPKLEAAYGSAWQRLQEIATRKTALEAKLKLQVPSYSPQLGRAVAIVTAATSEDAAEREAATKLVKERLRRNPLFDDLFMNHLSLASKWLGQDDPYVEALIPDGDARQALARLLRSQVNRDTYVDQLLEGGKDAIAQSDDPAIAAARVIAAQVERNQKLAEELEAQENVQATRIGRAMFAVYGDDVSPDATMTLRFSDGRVRGYSYNGTLAPYRTTFYGLFGRNVDFGGEHPFDVPEAWLERKDRIDMRRAVNFVSTNDIIGGNSGSPVVNKELEVVGLIFDGNIEQLPNRFLFRDQNERSVSVHVDAIMESLTKVYEARRVIEELAGGR